MPFKYTVQIMYVDNQAVQVQSTNNVWRQPGRSNIKYKKCMETTRPFKHTVHIMYKTTMPFKYTVQVMYGDNQAVQVYSTNNIWRQPGRSSTQYK